jgi:hypothetical protein
VNRVALLLLIGALISPQAASAQIGTIPLLDSLPTEGKCERFAGNAELKRVGDARMMTFSGVHPSRSITVGVDERGRPKDLMIIAGRPIPPRKSESENLIAFFTETGRVIRGDRRYFTLGIPASRSEDRHGGLSPADTAKIERIAKAVVARCGG